MNITKRYVVIKRKDKNEITYYEYDKKDGFVVHPKKYLSDLTNVREMIVVNPNLINNLINKKCKRRLEKIIKIMSLIYEEDSDDDTALEMVLDEIEHFRRMIVDKYQKYLEEKEIDLILKKLDILEHEINIKKIAIYERQDSVEEERGKGR